MNKLMEKAFKITSIVMLVCAMVAITYFISNVLMFPYIMEIYLVITILALIVFIVCSIYFYLQRPKVAPKRKHKGTAK